jgi:hypothetical protein
MGSIPILKTLQLTSVLKNNGFKLLLSTFSKQQPLKSRDICACIPANLRMSESFFLNFSKCEPVVDFKSGNAER